MAVWILAGLLCLANSYEALAAGDNGAGSLWIAGAMFCLYMTSRAWTAFRKFIR